MEWTALPHDCRRLVIKTRGQSRTAFPLPPAVVIQKVVYVSSDIPAGLLCFEAPVTRAWLHLYSLDGQPQTVGEVKWMLRAGYEHFHRPVWYVLDDTLYLFPAAPCDGQLVIDYVPQGRPPAP